MNKPEFVYMAIIAATPEDVWQGLTSAEFTQQYWHETKIQSDFKPGSPVEFVLADGRVGVTGEVLLADYPHKLSYSWQFTAPDETQREAHSRVTFTLERLNLGTRLTVVHDQFDAGSKTLDMVSHGWPHVICGLKTLLETNKAIDFSMAEADNQQSAASA
jgi:uncharacterized protein YndB with AHSA1/START domain